MTLCTLLTDWRGDLPEGGALVQPKHDGFRCLYFQGIDGVSRLWTRNGVPLEGADHVLRRCQAIEREAGVPMFLDGEIQVDGTLAATKHWFETGWKQGGDKGLLHLFDAMPLAEWQAGGSPTPLFQRSAWLADLVARVDALPHPWEWREGSKGADELAPIPVRAVESVTMHDPVAVVELARRVWATGGEGIVVKDPSSPYLRQRNPAWLKVKQENMGKWAHRFPHLARKAA